jgi:hypothetical protein
VTVTRLLVDNDVLLKAAHWDLLDLIPEAANTTWHHVSVLPQLPPRVKKRDRKLIHDEAAAERLVPRLARCAPLPEPDVQIIEALQGAPGVDAGELLLLAVLAGHPSTALLTGDKRALRLLAVPPLRDRIVACVGRLLCIDTWLLYALNRLGAGGLCQRIQPHIDLDKSMLAVLGREGLRDDTHVRDGLASYARAIEDATNGMLGPVPYTS